MSRPSSRLGIDFISVLGLDPVAHIELAAELDCGGISLAPAPFAANPHDYPLWSLREDAGLRGEVKAALAANGVALRLGEVFLIRPGNDMTESLPDLDLFAELGAERVNALSVGPDRQHTEDELGRLADFANARGLDVTLEWMAGMAVGTLAQAAEAVENVGRPNLTVLVDAMHLLRSGGTPADVLATAPALIGYAQLCDVPRVPVDPANGSEARDNRRELGSGDVPLAGLVAALPQSVPIGLELPMADRAAAGEGPKERLAASVAYAKQLLGE